MERLDKVLDPLLEFHLRSLAYAESFKAGASLKALRPKEWLRSKATLSVNPGRQTGKGCYTARAAEDKDIIVCGHPSGYARMVERRREFVLPHTVDQRVFRLVIDVTEFPDDVQDVWINSPSDFSEFELDYLYTDLAGRCRRFIILG